MSLYADIYLPNKPSPENVRKLDLLPIPMIRRMMRFGMRIDKSYLADLSARMGQRMADLRLDILNEIPPDALDRFMEIADISTDDEVQEGELVEEVVPFNVESGNKIAELLYDVLGLHLGKVTVKKTKGGERLNTGKKTLEQLKREHPVVPKILEYRENSKLKGTYADGLPRRAVLHPKGKNCPRCGRHHWSDEWRVHTKILTTRTATGRTASKEPNLGNIPTRTKMGAEIRAAFIASEGHVISQRDWSQIEVRLMADGSGDTSLIRIFVEDRDPHTETAMRAFKIDDPSKVDKLLHRAPSKNVTFGVAYGLQAEGLVDLMAVTYATAGKPLPDFVTKEWCEDFIKTWFSIYPGARAYFNQEEEKARKYKIVWTPVGRVRRIPEAASYHSYIQEAGVRQGCNHGIQGYSADIMKLAMGEAEERLGVLERDYAVPAYPLMTIYDELLIETPEDHGDTVQAVQEDVMDHVLDDRQTGKRCSRVPIKSEGKLLERWTK